MANTWETMQTVTDFIFLGSKITVDDDCSYGIKRHLLLGRKAMTNLASILKNRDITLPTKVHTVKVMVFSVVMYGCESWIIKKAESQRTDAFKLWCCRRLLRVPWTARRSNQSILRKSILNIHWKDWWWSWSSNTLATWCEQPTHWKRPNSLDKTLMLGKIEGRGRRGCRGWEAWMAIPSSMDMSLSELREIVKDREAWRAVVHSVSKSWTWQSNWTTTFTLNSYKLHVKIFYWHIVDLQHFRYTAKWFFFILVSTVSYNKILNIVLCATQ